MPSGHVQLPPQPPTPCVIWWTSFLTRFCVGPVHCGWGAGEAAGAATASLAWHAGAHVILLNECGSGSSWLPFLTHSP